MEPVVKEIRPRKKKLARASFSVNEFCKRHGMSRSSYYDLKKKGLGPREMSLGSRAKRISRVAEKEWIALMEGDSCLRQFNRRR